MIENNNHKTCRRNERKRIARIKYQLYLLKIPYLDKCPKTKVTTEIFIMIEKIEKSVDVIRQYLN